MEGKTWITGTRISVDNDSNNVGRIYLDIVLKS